MRNALRLTASALLLASVAGAPAFAEDATKKQDTPQEVLHSDAMKKGDAKGGEPRQGGMMMKRDPMMKKDDAEH